MLNVIMLSVVILSDMALKILLNLEKTLAYLEFCTSADGN